MQGDLTILARVQAWLAEPSGYSAAQNTILGELIGACSEVAMNYMGRQGLAAQTSQTVYDTWGNDFIMLRGGPIISISALEVGGVSLQPAVTTTWPPTSGWDLEPLDPSGANQQRLTLYGCCFPYARRSTRVTAMAGFLKTENVTAPASAPYTIQTSWTYLGDSTLTYANGTPLTLVSGSPAAGQYSISALGLVTLNPADASAALALSYSYVPSSIDNAVVQMVGEDYRRRNRIGLKSQSTGGGQSTTTYDMSDMPNRVKIALNPFRNVTPS